MMSFHLYDLALKLINAPKFISKDKEEEKSLQYACMEPRMR